MTELLQSLIEIDRMVTLSINGSDSLFLDSVAGIFTSIYIWIPLALAAIFLILRNIIPQRLILVLFMVVLTVLICDQVSSSFCKPFFHRLRPTHDPHLINMIDTVNGYSGGLYGFFSGHAANSIGLATLFMWLVRDAWFNVSVCIWAALNSYLRVYLGVHFLCDIVVGAIFGIIVGSLLYLIYTFLIRKRKVPFRDSVLYTKTGFLRKDIHSFLSVLSGTYIVILISSCMIW